MGNSVKTELKEKRPEENQRAYERRPVDQQELQKLEQVKQKLTKANKGNSKKGKNELQDLAEKLIDKEKTKREFFSHLLVQTTVARRVVGEEQSAFPEGFPNQYTRSDSEQRMAKPLEEVNKLEVKLILYELKDAHLIQEMASFIHKYVSSFVFGPFHAAILIGDVLIEWRPNSLVIPRRIQQDIDNHFRDDKAVLITNLHEEREALPMVPLQYEQSAGHDSVERTFEKIKDITRDKERLIDELAGVVVRYNTKFHYGILTNNCQKFVEEVLTVLGITDPQKVFRGRLKEHADLVMARHKKDAIVEFNSHQELDSHIKKQKLDEMSPDDLEFAYCHYLLFHAWGRRFPYEDAWRCNARECQANAISKILH